MNQICVEFSPAVEKIPGISMDLNNYISKRFEPTLSLVDLLLFLSRLSRSIKHNASSHGSVQAFYLTIHGETNEEIALFTRQAAESSTFVTNNNCESAGSDTVPRSGEFSLLSNPPTQYINRLQFIDQPIQIGDL